MFVTNLLLGCLVIIEFFNLCVRIMKCIPEDNPPLDDEIRIKMYS